MVELEVATPVDKTQETTETVALADDETPDIEIAEPVICDPVIGFVCPKHAAL